MNMSLTPFRTCAIAALWLCTGAAQAQVQRCQVEGRVVFQSTPCAIEARPRPATLPAPAMTARAGDASASTPATGPRKKTLADLLQERDGNDHNGTARAREFERDGATVLRTRMGAV